MYVVKKSVLAICVGAAVTLSACGGSSSGGSDTTLQDDSQTDPDTSTEGTGTEGTGTEGTGTEGTGTEGTGTEGTGTEGTGTEGTGTEGTGTEGTGTEGTGTEGTGTEGTGTETPVMEAPGSVGTVTVGGRTARALTAVGGPAAGVDGAIMRSIGDFQLNNSGQVAYIGSYESGTARPDAIWTGSVNAPLNVLYSSGSEISGLPSNVRYGNTDFFRLASDGSIAQLVQLNGPTENKALMVTSTATNSILVQTGGSLPGRSGSIDIGNVGAVSHSSTATAFTSGTSQFSGVQTLWYSKDGTTVSVTEQFDRSVESAAEVADTCRVFSGRFGSFDGSFAVSDSGDLLFDANVRNYASGPCVAGNAVIRYKDGIHTSVLKEGDIVPGAPASTFSDVDLIQVTKNGTALIAANVNIPTGGSRPDVKWSYWAVTASGEVRLVALEGEEIQVGGSTKTFSSTRPTTRYMILNDSVQAGLNLDFGNANETALFGGSAHTDQPHAALAAPGAASLTYAIDREATLPPPFQDSEFFSTIGNPAIDPTGNLIFYGEVTSSVLESVTSSSIWQIDLEGNLTQLITEGDTVQVSGVDNSLENLIQSDRFRQADSGFIRLNDSGAMMFRASMTNQSRNGVIVYLDPPVR